MNAGLTQVRCPNPKCGQIFLNSHETFCPECGTRLPEASAVPFAVASKLSRVLGFAIDFAISMIAAILLVIPGLGQILAALIWTVYFLFRDINGASLGKMAVGNVVISKNGGPASARQKILRNVLLVLPDLTEWIPLVGLLTGSTVLLIVLGVEGLSLMATGERLGDKIAGTLVVKRHG
jgi:uncharacterized RDD family membrane protein YckC